MAIPLSALRADCAVSHFYYTLSKLQGRGSDMEGLGKFKRINDFIGARTYDLPAWSIAPQPTTLRMLSECFRRVFQFCRSVVFNLGYAYYVKLKKKYII
jgi:hypothetical protein